MRRNFGKFSNPFLIRSQAHPAAFSTSSHGRGRGGATPFTFTVDDRAQSEPENHKNESQPSIGHGRGRGPPIPSSSARPSSFSFLNNDAARPAMGRGRGFVPQTEKEEGSILGKPPKSGDGMRFPDLFDDDVKDVDAVDSEAPVKQENVSPLKIMDVLSGAGRGKPIKHAAASADKPKSENRHIRPRQPVRPAVASSDEEMERKSSHKERLTQEDKVKKAVKMFSEGKDDSRRDADDFRAARGERGARGGRGRGAFGGRGRGRGRGRERFEDRDEDADKSEDEGLNLGDRADEEKVAQKLGPEVMNQLMEGFEEMAGRVLPSPADDAYIDALHTNLLIECEPEYMMEEFGTNPDIDEKPPIPLRDALEKMKPFLMAYEGIQSQEEWEEVIEETMKTVPLMKKIVDHYSGPDRVTAKEQQEELERVAKTLPASAPSSVKRFTERAVLSLKSNPGWGFDKKCQFMDKLIIEVSQQYK